MSYEIKLKQTAVKELKRLARPTAKRILVHIYKLADDPRPTNSKKLVGRPGFRLRIGDYRVVYEIHKNVLVIEVVRIAHRSEVYKD